MNLTSEPRPAHRKRWHPWRLRPEVVREAVLHFLRRHGASIAIAQIHDAVGYEAWRVLIALGDLMRRGEVEFAGNRGKSIRATSVAHPLRRPPNEEDH